MGRYSKGGLEVSEVVMVMFFVVIIIAVGMVVYFKYRAQGIEGKGEEIREEDANVLLGSITSMPEIRCEEKECLDASKFFVFKSIYNKYKDYYNTKLGNKRVRVSITYPNATYGKECGIIEYNSLDYPRNCDYWVLYDGGKGRGVKISKPVSIYFPELDEYWIGKIEVERIG